MPPRDRTRRRVEPTQERALASVDAILEAAERSLRERGFARTNTNQIAAVAGVNVSLVYRYFAGKEAIVGALIERGAQRTYDAASEVIRTHEGEPMRVVLPALIEAFVDTPGLDAELHRELVEHVDISARRPVLHELRVRLGVLFRNLLRAHAAELRPDADLEALSFVLQHALEAATHAVAFYRPRSLSRRRALAALCELVERALLR
ncbi:MAG TPA: TetR/AcrR family transcriptional regulator [Polyangiales bacterium]|nr:TetR/AcrR family transcriptional regulator [Polyangiales bacterium]